MKRSKGLNECAVVITNVICLKGEHRMEGMNFSAICSCAFYNELLSARESWWNEVMEKVVVVTE